jgi:HSP20 family protein
MSLVKWDPYRELELVSDRLNRVFGRDPSLARSSDEPMTVADWAPLVDIKETNEEYLIKAELPEVKKEDVKVAVKDGYLTLNGLRHQDKEEKGKRFHRIERSYGSFFRSFLLPDDVDDKKVIAEFKDGVLSVHLPKSEATKPRSVDVRIT